MIESECFIGWAKDLGNKRGKCCCNCRYQKPIVAHPWNKAELIKGSISKVIGYGCNAPEMEATVFFDREHGMCEMHDYKNNVVKLTRIK